MNLEDNVRAFVCCPIPRTAHLSVYMCKCMHVFFSFIRSSTEILVLLAFLLPFSLVLFYKFCFSSILAVNPRAQHKNYAPAGLNDHDDDVVNGDGDGGYAVDALHVKKETKPRATSQYKLDLDMGMLSLFVVR